MTHEEHVSLHFKGKTLSDEHKSKLSEAKKGNQYCKGKRWNLSDETKQKMSKTRKGKLKKKFKWLTTDGQIVEMDKRNAKVCHPDWVLINE